MTFQCYNALMNSIVKQDEAKEACPLCHNKGKAFYKNEFYECSQCSLIFRPKPQYPNPTAEKLRYEKHQNDVQDKGYQQFVSPIVSAVLQDYSIKETGLDFGAGSGSAVSKLLEDKGYSIKQYDPFFHDYPELLTTTYDYIVCCEVIEHFHNPAKEFQLLKELLKEDGSLYCMTNLYKKEIDFPSWYYKNDFTHVMFYQQKTLEWIKEKFGFFSIEIDNTLIKLTTSRH